MEDSLRLRPHHLLCIRFFRGQGYSPAFTRNMYGVIERLQAGEMLTLTAGMDSVCAVCPNNVAAAPGPGSAGTCPPWGRPAEERVCTSEERVQAFDRAVLAATGCKAGGCASWQDLQQLVTARIMEAGAFDAICGDCQWAALCHSGS